MGGMRTRAFEPAPRLVGPRVRLRPLSRLDEPTLRSMVATPAVAAWWHPPDDEFPFEHDEGTMRWAVELAHAPELGPTGALVGMVQAHEGDDPDYDECGIDLFLAPSVHRRGIGREVVTLVRDWLVDVRGHHLVQIDPAAGNEAAIACYRACGFTPVGVLHGRERNTSGTGWRDTLLMAYCSWLAPPGSS
jgi:aminoglycoside 6'-N-acetyltransferase